MADVSGFKNTERRKMYKWSKYPIGLGIMFFFLGVFFMFVDVPNSRTLILLGVFCIGGGVVMDKLLSEEVN